MDKGFLYINSLINNAVGVFREVLQQFCVRDDILLVKVWLLHRKVIISLKTEDFPLVKDNWVRELEKFDMHRSVGTDRTHPQCEKSWWTQQWGYSWTSLKSCRDQERCLKIGRKQIPPSSSKRARNRTQGSTNQPAAPQHLERWWCTSFYRSSLSTWMRSRSRITSMVFTKGKSCFGNLTAFCDEKTAWTNEGRAENFVYLDFNKVFNTVS